MGAEDKQYELPAELDAYMQDSIFHMLGFCSSEDDHQLVEKLKKSEESYRDLALHYQHLQRRLRELEHKRSKSKEEAVLNAQAVKRQVAEGQKLTEQCRVLREESNRLEQECKLYHNDRDVFMEAAYEAEDRAAEAEDRAAEVEKQNETLTEELERVRETLAKDSRIRLEMDDGDYVKSLNSRVAELEEENTRLQEEVASLRNSGEQHATCAEASLQVLLSAAEELNEERSREVSVLQEKLDQQLASARDEEVVRSMVTTAVTSGICKALEAEKENSLSALTLEFSSVFKCVESELGIARERAKLAELNVQALLHEVQTLRQDAALCRGNLDKAEVEVQMLADENKELRILLRRRCNGSESPLQNKGSKGGGGHQSQSGGRHRPTKTHEGYGEESSSSSICAVCSARQPLMPLPANSIERKLNRRQNLAVDENFCARSPNSPKTGSNNNNTGSSLRIRSPKSPSTSTFCIRSPRSPSIDLSPSRSIFQD